MITSPRRAPVLVSALVTLTVGVVAPPAEAAVPPPVVRDAGCAAALTDRLAPDGGGPVRVLGCDPAGRGLAVVALGDPATAAHVAVLVPGSDIDLATLADARRPQRRPFGWAQALAAAGGPGLAVVLWVGYPTPRGLGVDAASGRLARAGAAALVRFVDDLDAAGHVTVVGHSYGAVVVALAADDLAADDLVLLGSPGARAGTAAELGTQARVWAARAPDDWIGRVPAVRVGDLGHGADPADPGFGARRLPTGGARGHDGYFRPGSAALAAVAAVATGDRGAA
ncbi:alpha/beta hydrolase [Geodermatophilus sp. SYSU D00815]